MDRVAPASDTDFQLSRWGLEFVRPGTESAYRAWHTRMALPISRAAAVAAAVAWLLVLLSFWLAKEPGREVLAAGTLVNLLMCAGCFAMTYQPRLFHWLPTTVTLAVSMSGFITVGISMWPVQMEAVSMGGTIICAYFAFAVVRLRPALAAAAVVPYVTLHQGLMIHASNAARIGTLELVMYSSLPWIAVQIGLLASASIDRVTRHSFVQERVIERQHEQLRAAQTQLVQSEKMASLGSLVAGLAHDINTPIGAIGGSHGTLATALEKLQQLTGDGESTAARRKRTFAIAEDAVRLIGTASERIAELVKRLRTFARLDEAEMKTADIHESIEDTLALIRYELGERARVIKRFAEVPPIVCYPSQLNQLFMNLLVNAAHALGSAGGEIQIETRVEDGRVHVVITDTGSGIAEKDLPRIFDPGFTTKGVGVGSGLGLAICYQIARAHNGEIRVESKQGEGSRFTVVLPTHVPSGSKAP